MGGRVLGSLRKALRALSCLSLVATPEGFPARLLYLGHNPLGSQLFPLKISVSLNFLTKKRWAWSQVKKKKVQGDELGAVDREGTERNKCVIRVSMCRTLNETFCKILPIPPNLSPRMWTLLPRIPEREAKALTGNIQPRMTARVQLSSVSMGPAPTELEGHRHACLLLTAV